MILSAVTCRPSCSVTAQSGDAALVILSVDATRSSDSTIRLPTASDSSNQSCMRRRRPLMGRSLRDPEH